MKQELTRLQRHQLRESRIRENGIRYILKTIDLDNIITINKLTNVLIYGIIMTFSLLYSFISGDELFVNSSIIVVFMLPLYIVGIELFNLNKLIVDDTIVANELNIITILDNTFNLYRYSLANKIMYIFSFGLSFVLFIMIAGFGQIVLFIFFMIINIIFLIYLVEKQKKLLIISINKEGDKLYNAN